MATATAQARKERPQVNPSGIVSKPRTVVESDEGGSAPTSRLGPRTVQPARYNKRQRDEQFNALSEHNFRVMPRIEHEVQRRWVEELAQTISMTLTTKRASHFASAIKGSQINSETGQTMPWKYAHCLELPFTTFDNPWIADGFSAKDVTHAIMMSPAFGNSVVMVPMSTKEVDNYWEQKTSPQVLDAQNRVLDADFVSETLDLQERLMTDPPAGGFAGSTDGFVLPPMPA